MARLWQASMLVVALAVVACEDQDPPIYKDIVKQAIEAYNNGHPGKPLFRLKDVTVPPDKNPTSNFPLKFSIVETDCISNPEKQPENCNFLENGEKQSCTGQFLRKQLSTSLTLSCDKDCSTEGAQVNGSPDDSVAAVSEKDQLKNLPPNIRNIYENAKYDIINNILRNF